MAEFAGKKFLVLIFLLIITLITILSMIRVASEISILIGFRQSDYLITDIVLNMYSSYFFRANVTIDYNVEPTKQVKSIYNFTINPSKYFFCLKSKSFFETEDCNSLFYPISIFDDSDKETSEINISMKKENAYFLMKWK